jgi:hypothetical protein
MPKIHVVAEIEYATEVWQTSYDGETIPREKQTQFCALLPVTCSSVDRDIDLGSIVHVELPIAKVTDIPKDQRLRTAVYYAALEVKNALSRRTRWDLYKTEQIAIYPQDALTIPTSFEIEGDVEISDQLAAQFREATKRHSDVEQAMERAKAYLERGIDYAFSDGSRISRAARYLADCMRADGTLHMGPWNREKSAVLLGYVNDLVKRKKPNHPNYQSAASSVRSILYNVRCPTYWASYPPSANLLDLS